MTRVLITGGHGFVGHALFERLHAEGRDPLKVSRQALKPGELAIGEIGLRTDWSKVFLNCAVVIHLAARVHVMNDTEADPLTAFRAVNVDGTLNLARQASEAGIKRFVFISSVKVNGESTQPGRSFTEVDEHNPQDAYAQSKYEAEHGLRQIAVQTGMEVVIIRSPLVYGPGVKANFRSLMTMVSKGLPLPLGAVTANRRSLVAVDNLVDFIITCINHPAAANQVFLVSDDEDLSTAELLHRMYKANGTPDRLFTLPLWFLNLCATTIKRKSVYSRLCGSLQIDISKSKKILGWTPPVSVDEGLRLAFKGH